MTDLIAQRRLHPTVRCEATIIVTPAQYNGVDLAYLIARMPTNGGQKSADTSGGKEPLESLV